MNWIDLVIIGAVGLALLNGYRRGVVVQAFSWGGFLAGLLIGGLLAPPLVRAVGPETPVARAVVAMAAFLGIAFIIEAAIAFGGSKLVGKITHRKVLRADAILGAVVAAVMALFSAWFLSLPARRVPELARDVKRSAIMRGMYAAFRRPPDLLASVGAFLDRTGFPEVFTQFNPSLAPGVDPPPPSLRNDREILAAAELTYKIESPGCGGKVDGSGFPARRDLVVTAAHVVAGTRDTEVIEADGTRFDAVVVYFDSETDIAVLRVPTLPNRILRLDPSAAARGTDGAAIGYPGGGSRKISVARVRARTTARGRDIYSDDTVERDIYVLRASVRQGNSGGPFVDADGQVRGMIFAASAEDRDESYALAETEVQTALQSAAGRTQREDTGECAL